MKRATRQLLARRRPSVASSSSPSIPPLSNKIGNTSTNTSTNTTTTATTTTRHLATEAYAHHSYKEKFGTPPPPILSPLSAAADQAQAQPAPRKKQEQKSGRARLQPRTAASKPEQEFEEEDHSDDQAYFLDASAFRDELHSSLRSNPVVQYETTSEERLRWFGENQLHEDEFDGEEGVVDLLVEEVVPVKVIKAKRKRRDVKGEKVALEQPSHNAPLQPTTTADTRPTTSTLPPPLPLQPRAARELAFLETSTIKPYLPPYPLVDPHQLHNTPLLSRYDLRLSSPLPRSLSRSQFGSLTDLEPPDLSRLTRRGEVEEAAKRGVNRLVGVGLEPSREGRRWQGTEDETWGWKVKVPVDEKGEWTSCDEYRKQPDRLIALSRASDESRYLQLLARMGTPSHRESRGRTVTSALGQWLGDLASADKLAVALGKAEQLREEEREMKALAGLGEKAKGKGKGKEVGAGKMTAVSVWKKEDGTGIQDPPYVFTEGMVLRFTPEEEDIMEDEYFPTGPRSSSLANAKESNFVQGHLLEITKGELVVAFHEKDVWDIGFGRYRIDIGLDDSSYALQEQALDNLYFDSAQQRTRNRTHVQAAQEAFLNGTTSTLREWSLQGTDVRELLVPDLNDTMAMEEPQRKRRGEVLMGDLLDDFESGDGANLQVEEEDTTRMGTGVATAGREEEGTLKHPTEVLKDDQLIMSWVYRYQRVNPITMPGDPELGLNESQTRAVAMALGERLSLIQGPPGTGKSATIVSIIKLLKLHFRIPHPILLAAPTHVSVDHLLSLLISAGLNPLRIGKTGKVRDSLAQWTIEKRQEGHPLWSKMEKAREESEDHRTAMGVTQEELRDATKEGKKRAVERLQVQLGDLEEAYRKSWRRFIWLEQRLYSSLLATADVFCATAIGSATSKILNMIDFPFVFLDEAAMCTEPVTLIPLMKGAQQVTLIGDHKQLPAVVTSTEAKNERLHESLFERLMTQKSVRSVLLETQYRMRPAISAFPNEAFYNSELRDSASVSQRRPPPISSYFAPGSTVPTVFISHDCDESTQFQSTSNRGEMEIIFTIIADLLKKNPTLAADSIGIISPYTAQTRNFTWALENPRPWIERYLGRQRADEFSTVEVNTVDGFQGREKEVLIFSTVRSNPAGTIGFLKDRRRLNVALTRAKDALFVVGNERTLKAARGSERMPDDVDSDPGIWRRYLTWLESRNLVRKWDSRDFMV